MKLFKIYQCFFKKEGSVTIFHWFSYFKAGEYEQHPCKNLASELIAADFYFVLRHRNETSLRAEKPQAERGLFAVASVTKRLEKLRATRSRKNRAICLASLRSLLSQARERLLASAQTLFASVLGRSWSEQGFCFTPFATAKQKRSKCQLFIIREPKRNLKNIQAKGGLDKI